MLLDDRADDEATRKTVFAALVELQDQGVNVARH
jgi:hypothetical protein